MTIPKVGDTIIAEHFDNVLCENRRMKVQVDGGQWVEWNGFEIIDPTPGALIEFRPLGSNKLIEKSE